ncbi:MAG: LPS export ABC transporter ATP-binding protein [Abditibacteriaceae bacterium]
MPLQETAFTSNTKTATTIKAAHLRKSYQDRVVVNDISLEVNRGEVVGVLGPNGAGKTTTFYMVMGLVQPEKGRIMLGETNVTHWPMWKRADAGIGYLAQEPSVFKRLTVEENILAVLQLKKLPAKEQRQHCERLLEELDLVPRRYALGGSLSGGERRRTEIARTLATDPAFILLDEPFTGIDPLAVYEIQNIVLNLKERGIGILITDHNVHDTMEIINRGYIVSNGAVVAQGTSNELLSNTHAIEVYFGERIGRERPTRN